MLYISISNQEIVTHEDLHQRIFSDYGVNSTISYDKDIIGIIKSGKTQSTNISALSKEDYRDVIRLQMLVEIISYNVSFFVSVFVISMTILFAIIVISILKLSESKTKCQVEAQESVSTAVKKS